MSSIERNGPKHKVYIGHGTMKCPVYGLVMRDSKATYRYYRNSFKEEAIPTLRFKTAAEVAQLFQPVASNPPTAGRAPVPGKPASAAPTSR